MTTESQIKANRNNAKKSTGPKTPEGKAKVSQNATTHGLTASSDIIKGESQQQFDAHKHSFLECLNPRNAVEDFLADRVVSLAWRLKRAERIQNQFIDCRLLDHPYIVKDRYLFYREPSNHDPDLTLGAVINRDFSSDKILDRLKLYERRTENSFLKCLSVLEKRKRKEPLYPAIAPPDVEDRLIDSTSQDAQDLISLCKGSPNLCPRPSGAKKQTQSSNLDNTATPCDTDTYNLSPRVSGAQGKPNTSLSDTPATTRRAPKKTTTRRY